MMDKLIEKIDEPRIMLDSLTTIVLNAGEINTLKALQTLISRVKEHKGIGFLTLSPGIHSKNFENAVKNICTGIFEISLTITHDSLKRYIRILKLEKAYHEEYPLEFKIVKGKIIILS